MADVRSYLDNQCNTFKVPKAIHALSLVYIQLPYFSHSDSFILIFEIFINASEVGPVH